MSGTLCWEGVSDVKEHVVWEGVAYPKVGEDYFFLPSGEIGRSPLA